MTELWQLDATDLAHLIRMGRVSAQEATRACLDRLHTVNPMINAVVRVLENEALEAAREADKKRARGDALGPLHGVPVTTKVNTDQAGCPTDNGVVAYRDLMAREDSPVVANLRRAGAIIIGRTNAPAFSMRIFSDNALHGRTLNPLDPTVAAGGSSGGAGAAVATGIGPIAQATTSADRCAFLLSSTASLACASAWGASRRSTRAHRAGARSARSSCRYRGR
jgi:amidase